MANQPTGFDDADSVRGIDVSHNNGAIDWAAVAGANINFAYVKATEAAGFKDIRFRENYDACQQNGILRGAYHFFRANVDPKAQADSFIHVVGSIDGDLPPALDVESLDGKSARAVLGAMTIWLTAVEAALGRRPLIYTGTYFWNSSLGRSDQYSDYKLWVAQYTGRSAPGVPGGFNDYTFWQFTEQGQVPGIKGSADLDRFNGTMDELHALTHAS